MKRKILESLVKWKISEERKPLILNGARQVGKTYILEQFGAEHFENVVYLNMEIEGAVRDFIEKELSPRKIIQFIEVSKKQEIIPGKTLIFFDEIQACKRALTSLKYFCEQTPEYHIVSAGSLLGVAINREKYSFPVGKVNEFCMYPFDFEEFLWALGYEKLAEEIKKHYTNNEQMPDSLHHVALEPIEVKKGHRNRSKSLGVFMEKYKSEYAIRISKKNFGFENKIKSVPLYAVFCI